MSGDRGSVPERRDACRRTRGVIDRIVADTLTPADREHAATCPDCGPVLARSVRFDDALRRTARSMAAEALPAGILDPGLAGGQGDLGGIRRGSALRGFAPGLAGMAAAVMVVVLATGIALAPGGIGGPTESPPVESSFAATLPLFYPSAVIEAQLGGLNYVCVPGRPLATVGTQPGQAEREGVICMSPKEDTTRTAALITLESSNKEVVTVTIKGQVEGAATEAALEGLATIVAKLTFAAIADEVDAPLAGDWVNATLPTLRELPGGDAAVNAIGGIRITLQRDEAANFLVLLEPLASA